MKSTIPAPYSEAEQAFEREMRAAFGGTWAPPHKRKTVEMPAVQREALQAACRVTT